MPDREVKTIQDLIFYQYAKSAMKTGDNETAKKNHYGFIKKTFREQARRAAGCFGHSRDYPSRQRIDFKPDKIKGG